MAENTGINDTQLVVFRLGQEEFGVDISQVREIIRVSEITSIPNAPSYIDGVINLRGQITTVVNLRKKMGLEDKPVDGNSRIIVVEIDKNIVGMMVDSVTEVKYIAGSQIEMLPGMISGSVSGEYIQGVCKLPNRLLILVDLKKVISEVGLGNLIPAEA
ncbi:chemotaxis protein CheW [Methanocella sp. CWC-04]|uniref:Chemotaxis protein CheW n=1 Tax=Methanooceanicella nereidis TaxID=2052831 RepID=A0AAP2W6C3_9EURY|nr:chemotaxis protein CheW [Methanocella sp. CWC-04]MCD1293936.1 chemotaxis protein CheW [Methanocella sp. CWC-04]